MLSSPAPHHKRQNSTPRPSTCTSDHKDTFSQERPARALWKRPTSSEPPPVLNGWAKIDHAIAGDPRISPLAKAIWGVLQYWARQKDYCSPSDKSIAERIGKSKGHMRRGLDELENFGLIKRKAIKKTLNNSTGRLIFFPGKQAPDDSGGPRAGARTEPEGPRAGEWTGPRAGAQQRSRCREEKLNSEEFIQGKNSPERQRQEAPSTPITVPDAGAPVTSGAPRENGFEPGTPSTPIAVPDAGAPVASGTQPQPALTPARQRVPGLGLPAPAPVLGLPAPATAPIFSPPAAVSARPELPIATDAERAQLASLRAPVPVPKTAPAAVAVSGRRYVPRDYDRATLDAVFGPTVRWAPAPAPAASPPIRTEAEIDAGVHDIQEKVERALPALGMDEPTLRGRLKLLSPGKQGQIIEWIMTGDPVLIDEARKILQGAAPAPEADAPRPYQGIPIEEAIMNLPGHPDHTYRAHLLNRITDAVVGKLHDKKSEPFYDQVVTTVCRGEQPPELLVKALTKALGPQCKNPGAIFTTEWKRGVEERRQAAEKLCWEDEAKRMEERIQRGKERRGSI